MTFTRIPPEKEIILKSSKNPSTRQGNVKIRILGAAPKVGWLIIGDNSAS